MLTRSVMAVAVAVVLGASASVAKDRAPSAARSGGPPTIDVRKTCRESVAALATVQGGQDVDVCLSDEEDARKQLVKEWASYPASARSQCVQTGEFLPGYVEWLACVEITRDVLQLRKQESPGASDSNAERRSKGRRASSSARECPVAKYKDDGSIEYVISC